MTKHIGLNGFTVYVQILEIFATNSNLKLASHFKSQGVWLKVKYLFIALTFLSDLIIVIVLSTKQNKTKISTTTTTTYSRTYALCNTQISRAFHSKSTPPPLPAPPLSLSLSFSLSTLPLPCALNVVNRQRWCLKWNPLKLSLVFPIERNDGLQHYITTYLQYKHITARYYQARVHALAKSNFQIIFLYCFVFILYSADGADDGHKVWDWISKTLERLGDGRTYSWSRSTNKNDLFEFDL